MPTSSTKSRQSQRDTGPERKPDQSDQGVDISPIERRCNVYAAVSFVILMGCIGLPQWWRTTRVNRAPLPYSEISRFEDAVLTLPVSISLISGDDSATRVLRDDGVASKIKEAVSRGFDRLAISLELSEREASDVEKRVLASPFGSFEDLEKALYTTSIGSRGRKIQSQNVKGDGVEIFVLHRLEPIRIHFGSGTRIFIVGNLDGSLRQELSALLISIILHTYLRMDELLATVTRHTKQPVQIPWNSSRTSLSTCVFHPNMTLEVHVVDPEPIRCSQRFFADQIMDDAAVKGFLSSIQEISKISVKSHVIYYVDFSHEPIQDSKSGFYYLNPVQLQHMINPIETHLGTVVTTEPVYHVLLYVPPESVAPLMVPSSQLPTRGDNLRPAPYNSFVVSGWGSVTVINANRSCTHDGVLLVDPTSIKAAKTAVVANLRKLFGLQLPVPFERSATAAISDWEVQSLRYRALVEYMFSSMRTLSSLTKLLGEVTNIVINDDIAASIGSAVSEVERVLYPSHDGFGGHWRMHSMLESGTVAFLESEKAFFDPSLLAMLYFPDDQKYAIYVPLFLPIGVPVLGSIMFIYKYLKQYRSEKDKKE